MVFFQDSDFAGDLEDLKIHMRMSLVHFWKSNICTTSARRRVQRASTSGSPRFTTEHALTNACATPDTLIKYVASAGTCAAPAPVFEAECDEDASPKTYGPLETMHTDEAASRESSETTVEPGQEASDGEDSESDAPFTPELDIVFDAL